MDMVEKVARAIAGVGYGEREHHPWDCLKRDDPEDASFVLEQARAAIEAMREPAVAVFTAGLQHSYSAAQLYQLGVFTKEQVASRRMSEVGAIWQAMIDQALSDQPRPTEEKA